MHRRGTRRKRRHIMNQYTQMHCNHSHCQKNRISPDSGHHAPGATTVAGKATSPASRNDAVCAFDFFPSFPRISPPSPTSFLRHGLTPDLNCQHTTSAALYSVEAMGYNNRISTPLKILNEAGVLGVSAKNYRGCTALLSPQLSQRHVENHHRRTALKISGKP